MDRVDAEWAGIPPLCPGFCLVRAQPPDQGRFPGVRKPQSPQRRQAPTCSQIDTLVWETLDSCRGRSEARSLSRRSSRPAEKQSRACPQPAQAREKVQLMGLDQPQAWQVLGGWGGDQGEATVTARSDGITSATPVGWTRGGGPVTRGRRLCSPPHLTRAVWVDGQP